MGTRLREKLRGGRERRAGGGRRRGRGQATGSCWRCPATPVMPRVSLVPALQRKLSVLVGVPSSLARRSLRGVQGPQRARQLPSRAPGRAPGPGSGCGGMRGMGRPIRHPREERKAAALTPTHPCWPCLPDSPRPTSTPGRQGQAGNVICVSAVSSHPAPVHPEAWSGACFSLCPGKWVFQRGSRRTRLLSFVSGGF